MNDSKIKVLLVEPEKYPKEIVIDDSLEAMQEVVGGNIEESPKRSLLFESNEYSKLFQYPYSLFHPH